MEQHISIYTDGASRGNPGTGGYGVLLMYKSHVKELSGGFRKTTNNRMELMAVIEGLKALKTDQVPIMIYSDSQYVVNAISKGWLKNWIKTGFKGGKKNKDLWMEYYQLSQKLKINITWVKGHANNPYNNRCDQLATTAADSGNLLVDKGFEQELIS